MKANMGKNKLISLNSSGAKGFLSPGGTAEVDLVIEGLDLSGLNILDIGCGCGGAVFHLIKQHGASTAIGIDIEPLVIARAKALADEYHLGDKASFEVVTPAKAALS